MFSFGLSINFADEVGDTPALDHAAKLQERGSAEAISQGETGRHLGSIAKSVYQDHMEVPREAGDLPIYFDQPFRVHDAPHEKEH
jgi:hypothetical protein